MTGYKRGIFVQMGEENMTVIQFDIERKKKYKHTRERADQFASFFFFSCILGSRDATDRSAALCRSDDFSLATTLSLILNSALMRSDQRRLTTCGLF